MDALDTAKIKQTAWDKLDGKWSQAAVAVLVFMLISIVIDIPSAFFEKDSTGQNLWKIIETPFALGLDIGLYAYFLNFTRNKETPLKRLVVGFTSGWGFYFNLICTQILALLLICLWGLLLIVPGIMKAFSYSLIYFIILDHPEYSHFEVLQKSSNMMYGHRMELFVLCLRFIPWLLLGIVTCGIGFLWVCPYMTTAFCEFYQQLKAKNEDVPEVATLA
ncbi:DUF975 family protein [Fibrobacter sp.]|uniref:DUF975 family protein n=1 Tax=Fibrobacter sp. TaxID=35828 RepID=UPI0038679D75